MSDDFDDILNRTWEEIPKAQVLPVGNWMLVGKNVAYIRAKTEAQKPKVLFTYKAKEALDGVDEDELQELVDSGYDININDLNYTVYLESAADWDKVRDHLATHGLSMSGSIFDDRGKLAFNRQFRGAEVVSFLEQRNWEDDAKKVHWDNKLTNFRPVAD